MHSKSGKIYGNYLGWVVNHTPDPEGRMRIQVFVPHLTNTLYDGWNKNLVNKGFRNPNELGSKTLKILQQTLPWAECAMPIFGGATAMKANATTDIVNVNGGNSFNFSSAAAFGAAAGIPLDGNIVGPGSEEIADMSDESSEEPIDPLLTPLPGPDLTLPLEDVPPPPFDENLPPLSSPVDEAAEDPNKTNGLDTDTTGNGETDPQAVNFNLDQRTRDQRPGGSIPGAREIALDFNYGNARGAVGIVIPTNYTPQELAVAINYIERTKAWYASHGINRPYMTLGNGYVAPGVYNLTGNGTRVTRFHTEPFMTQDSIAAELVRNNTPAPGTNTTYTQILADTLGRLPGAVFIPPHQQGSAGGANYTYTDVNGNLITINERDFASQFILPGLAQLNGQTLDTTGLVSADGQPAERIPEDPTDVVQVNIPGNQGSVPDTTIAGNGSPNGFFSVPAYGAKVWVFFYDGDIQRPIYFASVVEPSAGQTT